MQLWKKIAAASSQADLSVKKKKTTQQNAKKTDNAQFNRYHIKFISQNITWQTVFFCKQDKLW